MSIFKKLFIALNNIFKCKNNFNQMKELFMLLIIK